MKPNRTVSTLSEWSRCTWRSTTTLCTPEEPPEKRALFRCRPDGAEPGSDRRRPRHVPRDAVGVRLRGRRGRWWSGGGRERGCSGASRPYRDGPVVQLVQSAATQFGLPQVGAPDMESVGDVVLNHVLVLDLSGEDRLAAPVAGVAPPKTAPHLLGADAQQSAGVESVADVLRDGDLLVRHREFSPVGAGYNAHSPGSRRLRVRQP